VRGAVAGESVVMLLFDSVAGTHPPRLHPCLLAGGRLQPRHRQRARAPVSAAGC
jgi:hypothetical protein